MTEMNMVEALNSAFHSIMKKDKSVVVLGEDVGVDGGVFRVTKGLIEKHPKRVFDTPLAEAAIIGTSVGLAVGGLKPIAECQFSGFMYQAFYQIEQHVARMRNRTRGQITLPMVIRAPYGGGIRALEHHSESKEAFYAHTPGLKVVIPSNPYDAKGLLIASVNDPDPVIFLEPKRIYRAFKQEIPEDAYEIELGKAHIVQEGENLTLISWGAMMRPTLDAAEELEAKNIKAEVIDLRTIQPLDVNTIIESVKKTGRCIVIHEAQKMGGWGAEITAQINERILDHLMAPVGRVCGYDVTFPYFALEEEYLPDTERILKKVNEVMNY
ncbi:MAG: alpha-ketoacid dehydrogenase subunit beta [Candidatus Nanoarchaeia archaeon]